MRVTEAGRARHIGRMVSAAHPARAARERDRIEEAGLLLPPELACPGDSPALDQAAAAQGTPAAVLVVVGVGGEEVPDHGAGLLTLRQGPGPGVCGTHEERAEQQCREEPTEHAQTHWGVAASTEGMGRGPERAGDYPAGGDGASRGRAWFFRPGAAPGRGAVPVRAAAAHHRRRERAAPGPRYWTH